MLEYWRINSKGKREHFIIRVEFSKYSLKYKGKSLVYRGENAM